VLFGPSDDAAQTFWKLVDEQFLPAAKAGDATRIHQVGAQITSAYRDHRKAADTMAPALDAYTRAELKSAEDAVTLSRIILFLAGALTSLAVYLGVPHGQQPCRYADQGHFGLYVEPGLRRLQSTAALCGSPG